MTFRLGEEEHSVAMIYDDLPWVPEGFFFVAKPLILPREKKVFFFSW